MRAWRARPSRRSFLRGTTGVAALAGVAGVPLLSGCAEKVDVPTEPAAKGTAPKGKLTLLFQGSARDKPSWDRIFAAFGRAYPGVTIDLINSPSANWPEFFSNLQVKLAGGQAFDGIYIPTEGQRLFTSKGLVQSLDAWIERDQSEIDDFLDDADERLVGWARDLASTDGRTYYLPYGFNTMAVWYRKSILREAGAPMPEAGWTWADLRDIAERATKRGRYGMDLRTGLFDGLSSWLLTNGTDIVDSTWRKATIDNPAAVEAMRFARRLVRDSISPTPGGTFDNFNAMVQGKLAMLGAGRWPITTMREEGIVDDLAIAPWPKHVRNGTPIGWGSMAMLRDAPNKEAMWALIKFLLTDEAQRIIARDALAGIVPARRSAATSKIMLDNSPAGTEILYDSLAFATPVPGPDRFDRISRAVEDTYRQVLTGNALPGEELPELNDKITESLRNT